MTFDEKSLLFGDDTDIPRSEGWPCYREHSLFESAIREASRELQVSREMATMSALGAISTACQNLIMVELPTGHIVNTSLMLLTVASSGERKTTVQNHFFRSIQKNNFEAHLRSEENEKEYKKSIHLWTEKRKALDAKLRKKIKEGEEGDIEIVDQEIIDHWEIKPVPERSGKFLFDDTTPQALVQLMHENSHRACLLTSEASSIFSGRVIHEMDKLNTLWDGGDVIVDRVTKGSFILNDARLTMSLMAQPTVIDNFLEKKGDEARGIGFLARLLVVYARSMAGERQNKTMNRLKSIEEFNLHVDSLIKKYQSKNTGESADQILSFSSTAKDLWETLSNGIEYNMKDGGVFYFYRDHASKLMENISRIAASLHCFERESESDTEIDKFTLHFSYDLALKCSHDFMYHLASEPQIVKDTNKLVDFLIRAAQKECTTGSMGGSIHSTRGLHKSFKLTDIKQYGPGALRGRSGDSRLKDCIRLLEKLGHVEREGGAYYFQETVIGVNEPEIKNGYNITITSLPLFDDQELYQNPHKTGMSGARGYYRLKENDQ